MKKEINEKVLNELKEKCSKAGYNYTINDDSIILFKSNMAITISELVDLDLDSESTKIDLEPLVTSKEDNEFTKEEYEMLELATKIFDEYINIEKTPIKRTVEKENEEEDEFRINLDNLLDPVVEEFYTDEFYDYEDSNIIIRELTLSILRSFSIIRAYKKDGEPVEEYSLPTSKIRALISVILHELGINVGDFIDEVDRYHNNEGMYYKKDYTTDLFAKDMDSVLTEILLNNHSHYFECMKEKIKQLCLILVNAVTFQEPLWLNGDILEDYGNICIYKEPWHQYDRENIVSYVLEGEYVEELFELPINDQIRFLGLVANNELDDTCFDGIPGDCEDLIDEYRGYLAPTLGITIDINNLTVDVTKNQVVYKKGNMDILITDQVYKHYLINYDKNYGGPVSEDEFLRNELCNNDFLKSLNGVTI